MKNMIKITTILFVTLLMSTMGLATNGDNLIGIGPISRAMGGVGIAAPQDAVSAVFANPSAQCFGPFCPSTEVDFAATAFIPEVQAKISNTTGTYKADSDDEVYMIPAFGLSVPISQGLNPPIWRYGLAAYGVSGLGVDYRGTDIDQPIPAFGGNPLASGTFTQFQTMRFAPSLAFQPVPKWSFGLAGILEYSNLDLGEGSDWSYGFGIQAGITFKPISWLSLGVNYISPRDVSFENVADFDGDGDLDNLDLDSPQELGFGAAVTFGNFLIEGDTKWINWGDADGYEDFDWDDQYVFAVGGQWQALPKLFLRAGYNYAKNPLDENNGFSPALTSVQGKSLPGYYYETFRAIGFPAIVEHHVTFGLGYEFTPNFALNLGYVHGFEETFEEKGTDFAGPSTIESKLSEDSIDFGLTWRF
jgi:long-chain fatty acid transport protein